MVGPPAARLFLDSTVDCLRTSLKQILSFLPFNFSAIDACNYIQSRNNKTILRTLQIQRDGQTKMKSFFFSAFLATTICVLNDVVGMREDTFMFENRVSGSKENNGPVKQRGKMKAEVSLDNVRQFFLDVWATVEKRATFLCAAEVVQEKSYTMTKGAVFLANRSINTSVGPIIFQKHNSSATLITFYFRFVVHRSRRIPAMRLFKPMRVLVRIWREEQVRLINYCDDKESRDAGLRCRQTKWPMAIAKDALCRLVCVSACSVACHYYTCKCAIKASVYIHATHPYERGRMRPFGIVAPRELFCSQMFSWRLLVYIFMACVLVAGDLPPPEAAH